MARYRRLDTLVSMKQLGLIPTFHHTEIDVARAVLEALADGGARAVEFLNRGDRALQIFAQLEEWCCQYKPEIILGAGAVVDAPTAALFVAAGASFIGGPLLDPDTARLCNSRKIPYFPGCSSATEVHQAHLLGVEICKLFPSEAVGGPAFVKHLLGSCPWADLMASGGISPTRESISAWFGAGIACAEMGTQLLSNDLLERRDYSGITAITSDALQTIREVRG